MSDLKQRILDKLARGYYRRAEFNETYKDWKQYIEKYQEHNSSVVERAVDLALAEVNKEIVLLQNDSLFRYCGKTRNFAEGYNKFANELRKCLSLTEKKEANND